MHAWVAALHLKAEIRSLFAALITFFQEKQKGEKSSKANWIPLSLFQSWNVQGNGNNDLLIT